MHAVAEPSAATDRNCVPRGSSAPVASAALFMSGVSSATIIDGTGVTRWG